MSSIFNGLKVAVWMITYNHERYIAAAIESVISQKTDFKFRLFIGEDCSTDQTRAICLEYANKYPELITLICTETNNLIQNGNNIYKATFQSGAEYIAMLEGDDYWSDENKLQKQVDFLDANPDFSLSCSDVELIRQVHVGKEYPEMKEEFTIEDYILNNYFIFTGTLFYRNILGFPLPPFFLKTICGDVALAILLLDKGKGKYFPEKMAAYRLHSSGASNGRNFTTDIYELFDQFNDYTKGRHLGVIKTKLFPLAKLLLMFNSGRLKGRERRLHILRMFKGYNKYRDGLNLKEILYYVTVLTFPKFFSRLHKRKAHEVSTSNK